MKQIDISGHRFGRLVAVSIGEPHVSPSRKQVTWICKCDCGNEVTIQRGALRSGASKSCGCSYKDLGIRKRTARHENNSEYSTWFHLKQRCINPKDKDFNNYGGRGIKVCSRWLNSFDNFFEDMGKKPSDEHSIDRIDVNGDYTAENCRWATPIEQSRNRRNTRYYSETKKHEG